MSSTQKSQKIMHKLKSAGHRLTPARKAILDIIYASSAPLTAALVGDKLASLGIVKNKTTVYRELSFLQKEKLIREVDLGLLQAAYESAKEDHHHHLICKNCRRVEHINLKKSESILKKETRKISQKNRFINIEHSLEFFGTCEECVP